MIVIPFKDIFDKRKRKIYMAFIKLRASWPLLMASGAALVLCSCGKEAGNVITPASNSTSATDYVIVSNAMNALADDAALSADQTNGIARGIIQLPGVCGSSAVDTSNGQTVTITYDSTTFCEGVIRSGSVSIALTTRNGWSTRGAVITVTIINLGVNDPMTNQQLTLNGSFTITNESGGLLAGLSTGPGPIIRRHQSLNSIQVTNSGTTTNWSFDRTRSWANLNINSTTVYNISEYSEASSGVECTGVNRFGQVFTSNIDTTIQADTYKCPLASGPLMEPYAGVVSHNVAGLVNTIAYGTNIQDTHTGTDQSCPSGGSSGNYGYFITYIEPTTNYIGYTFWAYYL